MIITFNMTADNKQLIKVKNRCNEDVKPNLKTEDEVLSGWPKKKKKNGYRGPRDDF